ncbi:tyrosine-type recombinase/integrase [Planctomycetota bacterium]|nr:tyrosine-type recombinase/integrase [Planctomycetota bacterium]
MLNKNIKKWAKEKMYLYELIEKYKEYALDCYVGRDGKPTNEFKSIRQVLSQLNDYYPMIRASRLRPLKVIEFRDDLIERDNTIETINDKVSRIKRMYRYACEREYVDSEVFVAVNSVTPLKPGRCRARANKKVNPVDWKRLRAVLRVSNDQLQRMIRVHYLTGMRPTEFFEMKWQDLKIQNDVALYVPEDHKTSYLKKKRYIVFGPRVIKLLGSNQRIGYVFKTKYGTSYNKYSYRREIVRACERAGVEKFTPRQLRHNSATRFCRRFGISVAKELLGHETEAMTRIYVEDNVRGLLDYARQAV